MRILLVAAAVVLSVSAAQAQATGDRALPAATPSSTLIEQLKAAGELKDPKALEAPAPKLESLPAEQPVAAKPAETTAPAAAPAATAAAPAATPAAAPAPATTTAAKPAETKAAETKPADAVTTAKPAKKRVARKRETNEQKARRIAAKYGISW